jgi:hypothetical protein
MWRRQEGGNEVKRGRREGRRKKGTRVGEERV